MIEPAEPPHSHHHATGIPWFDLLVPLAVIVVSVASLLTSLASERSMKALVEQNRRLVSAQSTPLLMYDTSNDTNGKSVIQLTLSNEGTGPARLFWFKAVDSQGVDYTGRRSDRACHEDRSSWRTFFTADQRHADAEWGRANDLCVAEAETQSRGDRGLGKAESRALPPAPERLLLLDVRRVLDHGVRDESARRL